MPNALIFCSFTVSASHQTTRHLSACMNGSVVGPYRENVNMNGHSYCSCSQFLHCIRNTVLQRCFCKAVTNQIHALLNKYEVWCIFFYQVTWLRKEDPDFKTWKLFCWMLNMPSCHCIRNILHKHNATRGVICFVFMFYNVTNRMSIINSAESVHSLLFTD
jgi:hypothetical protein